MISKRARDEKSSMLRIFTLRGSLNEKLRAQIYVELFIKFFLLFFYTALVTLERVVKIRLIKKVIKLTTQME